jgi:hypothetical protein
MDRVEQVNLNHKTATEIMGWRHSIRDNDDRWVDILGGFTGYYSNPNTRFESLYWDPCANSAHALMLFSSELMRKHRVWIQVIEPFKFRAQVYMLVDDDLLQGSQFYTIFAIEDDRWVEVAEKTAEQVICKAAEVIMDIMLCRKLNQEDKTSESSS